MILQLSQGVKDALRKIDIIMRWGENYYVVIPVIGIEGGFGIFEKPKEDLDGNPVGLGVINLQLEMGLVSYTAKGDYGRTLIGEVERRVHE